MTITGPEGATIRYGFSQENLTEEGMVYTHPIEVDGEGYIYAIAIVNGVSSEVEHEYLATADDH